jgi:hypothetical protein
LSGPVPQELAMQLNWRAPVMATVQIFPESQYADKYWSKHLTMPHAPVSTDHVPLLQ